MGTSATRWLSGLAVAVGLVAAQVQAGSTVIGHASLANATNPPTAISAKVGKLRWFFTHASVGGNLVTGMNVLHAEDGIRYPLQVYGYDGDNGDSAYHGAVGTAGSEGGADYRSAADPASTSNGFVYECMRGNPDWSNKLICFSNSVVASGWRFPKVNVVMDKFCWIDPYADPAEYCAMMAGLEARYPQTLFVYMTMPLTTETAGSDNDARNDFNRYVRGFCEGGGKWLLDLADIEAWSEAGVQQTYVSGGVTNQRMVSAYAVGAGGGDYHLNATGRRRGALGWNALAQALFQADRDGDGVRDGDELIAGTAPANDTDCLQLILDPATDPTRQVVTWTGATNRWYSIQEATSMVAGTVWSNRATNLPVTGALNAYTIAVPAASSYLRLAVQQ